MPLMYITSIYALIERSTGVQVKNQPMCKALRNDGLAVHLCVYQR